MKISKSTLDVLANFAQINPSIIIQEGKVLRTINMSKSCVGRAEIDDEFPKEFAIYNLNEFLTMIKDLFGGAPDDIEFGAECMTFMQGQTKARYRYTDKSVVFGIEKDPTLPDSLLDFKLTSELMGKIVKSKSIMGLEFMTTSVRDGKLFLAAASDQKGKSTSVDRDNELTICMGDYAGELTDDYRMSVKIENLKMIPGDYNVSVHIKGQAGMMKFESDDGKLSYFIAMDRANSTIPGSE